MAKKLKEREKEEDMLTETLEKPPQEDSWLDKQAVENRVNGEIIPDRLSPQWSDWVMKQFDKSELYVERDGKKAIFPRVHGLRRLAQIYVGEITRSQCHVCTSGPNFSSFIYEIEFIKENGRKVVYSDAADVSSDNADENYLMFPSALAVTRAEARTLRKALGLITCSAEELAPKKKGTEEAVVNTDTHVPEKINAAQKNHIQTHCKTLNIHPWCLLNSGVKKYKSTLEISFKEALDFCKILGDWVRDKKSMERYLKEKNVEIKTFVASWESEVS